METKKREGLWRPLLIAVISAIAASLVTYWLTPSTPPQSKFEQPKTATVSDSATQNVMQQDQTFSNSGPVNVENILGDKVVSMPPVASPPVRTPVKPVDRDKTEPQVINSTTGDNSPIVTGEGAVVTVNAKPEKTLGLQDKHDIVAYMKQLFEQNGGDFYKTLVYVIRPNGHDSPDEVSVANDLKKYLKEKGCNVSPDSYMLFTSGCNRIQVGFEKGAKSMVIMVCLPE